MASADLNGTTLHFELHGDGPRCLVLHGWPGADHTYMRPGLDVVGERLGLVYLDHRGHGRSARPEPHSITVEQLADDAAALIGHLGGSPALVLGHYQGASVAQELALRHPDRVAGLVLVSATPGQFGAGEGLSDTLEDTPTPVEVEVLQRVPPATDDEWAATMVALARFFSPNPGALDPEALFDWSVFDAEAARQGMKALDFWSSVDRLDRIGAPTLLVSGRHDSFCAPSQSARIERRVAGSRRVVLEESGHLPWLDEPEAFSTAVGSWLDGSGA